MDQAEGLPLLSGDRPSDHAVTVRFPKQATPVVDAVRNALIRRAAVAARRRFTDEPLTGFGGL